jgi:hypothetical protein
MYRFEFVNERERRLKHQKESIFREIERRKKQAIVMKEQESKKLSPLHRKETYLYESRPPNYPPNKMHPISFKQKEERLGGPTSIDRIE